MKSVKRRDLKAILQEEPGRPSAPSLSPLERLANQTTVSQSTTNSSQPPEKTKAATDSPDSTRSDALTRLSEVPIQPEVPSTSLEPPPPPPVGFRQFRTIGGLRGETPSLAPLPPSPDGFHLYVPITLPHEILSLTLPGSFGHSSRSRCKLYAVDELDAFREARQSLSAKPAASSSSSTPVETQVENTFPSGTSRCILPSSAFSQPHQAARDPSSSPIARSASRTTPSPASLPSEPGSSPFPEEGEDEKDDGPDTEGKPSGERAATGGLDELEEFYGTKESVGGTQDVGDDEGEQFQSQSQSQSQCLNVKDPFGFQTQAFPKSTLGEDSY